MPVDRPFLTGQGEVPVPEVPTAWFVNQAHGATPIVYRCTTDAGWEWTPSLGKDEWESVSTTVVSKGLYANRRPVPENISIINFLRRHQPRVDFFIFRGCLVLVSSHDLPFWHQTRRRADNMWEPFGEGSAVEVAWSWPRDGARAFAWVGSKCFLRTHHVPDNQGYARDHIDDSGTCRTQ